MSEIMRTENDTYTDLIEGIKDAYEDRIMALLRRVRDEVRAAGLYADSEAWCDSGDEYHWTLVVWTKPLAYLARDSDRCIDVRVELVEERVHEGGEGFGVTFSLDITAYGGRMLGGLSPYNYTEEWIVDGRDAEAVEDRWSLLQDADTSSIPDLLRANDEEN